MAKITIGVVELILDGETLTITRRDQPNMAISLDETGVRELIEFVTSFTGSKFNQRLTFRVPVGYSSGLAVQIRKNEIQRSVTPTNISLTGIFVELRSDDWLELALDDELEVILDFEGERQSCRGVVRRCADNGYGLFFPESMRGMILDPPPKITQIVMELQRRWIARRSERVQ